LEDKVETVAGSAPEVAAEEDQRNVLGTSLRKLQDEAAEWLAHRLLAQAIGGPGFLVLNPCSFTRRVALELEGITTPLSIGGPIKACQIDDKARVVVEVPALGFTWVPKNAQSSNAPPKPRMRLADNNLVRNEFFEAEIDPTTGGLRSLRDHLTRANRIGQQLVFQPGSTMRAKEVRVTSSGPALGEVISTGWLLDQHEKVLATFRQRYRAWLGRPLLELRIELYPQVRPQGYPWHAYYGARFAWRDERATLLRGVNGISSLTSHTRPVTPDYLELRAGRRSTCLFPGGLPFHQRHGARMLDVILIPEGESTDVFDLALGLDREHPMQTALGLVTPVPVVAAPKGPPHVGATGWLFHLDAPNLLLTSLRPAADGADAIEARLVECANHSGRAELRCVRDPRSARLLDGRGHLLQDAGTYGDTVNFEVPAADWSLLRVEFG
jgi:hypothetical protein